MTKTARTQTARHRRQGPVGVVVGCTTLMLLVSGVTSATLSGEASQCFVEGFVNQTDVHPAQKPPELNFGTTPSFTNTLVTPVTVTCPLNVHPALEIDGAVIELIRLPGSESSASTDNTVLDFSCALMTRAADGGQASGRRVSRADPGLLHLPEAGHASQSTAKRHEASYRYIQCELPGYSAIARYSTQVTVSDGSAQDRQLLLDTFKEAENTAESGVSRAVLPRLNDKFIQIGHSADGTDDSSPGLPSIEYEPAAQ